MEEPLVDRLAGSRRATSRSGASAPWTAGARPPGPPAAPPAGACPPPARSRSPRAARPPCRPSPRGCGAAPSRIPFCVMICQIVSASDNGATPTIASAILGCCENAAARAKLPVKHRRHELQERHPQEPHQPLHAAIDPPVQRADMILGQDGQVHLHQVGDDPHIHVLVDPGAGPSRPGTGAGRSCTRGPGRPRR